MSHQSSAPIEPTVTRIDGRIEYRHLKERDVVKKGLRKTGRLLENQHADVVPGVSVTLHGSVAGRTYKVEFKLGDLCEYNLNQLVHYGKIIAIGDRTVTIFDEDFRQNSFLELPEFSRRNWAFDATTVQRGAWRVRAAK